jgi:hypothetical protein
MVLVSYLLLNNCGCFKKIQAEENYNNYILNNFLRYLILVIIIFICVFPALIIAYSTTKGYTRILHIIIGFFFSDIYLCYYVINQYL